ncbi:MAG: hypothetical protein ACSI46_09450 [Gloeotrichia echinulata DVL01]|nr:hypothetical protein [Gloeotrichia echinulata DEX184]
MDYIDGTITADYTTSLAIENLKSPTGTPKFYFLESKSLAVSFCAYQSSNVAHQ